MDCGETKTQENEPEEMRMETTDIKKIQRIAIEILFDIVDVCEKNNIEYCLMYGTLLGAVRHQGMIPWDDDIDIGMNRENFYRFLKIAPELISDKNEIKIMGAMEYLPELKIGRKGTAYCLKEAKELNISREITVDVFLIDYTKEQQGRSIALRRKLRTFLRLCALPWDEKKLLIISIGKSQRHFKWLYKAGLYGMHILRMIVGETAFYRWVYKMFVDISKQSGEASCVIFDDYTFSADYKMIQLPFEGRMLNVPDNYNDILTKSYGDYMKLPPENERYKKHIEDWILKIDSEAV